MGGDIGEKNIVHDLNTRYMRVHILLSILYVLVVFHKN